MYSCCPRKSGFCPRRNIRGKYNTGRHECRGGGYGRRVYPRDLISIKFNRDLTGDTQLRQNINHTFLAFYLCFISIHREVSQMIHFGHGIKNNTHIGAGCLQLDLGLNTSGSDKNRELDYRLVIEFRAGYCNTVSTAWQSS